MGDTCAWGLMLVTVVVTVSITHGAIVLGLESPCTMRISRI
jgi:hypothetical protein